MMCANSKGFDQPAQMCRLVQAFADCMCIQLYFGMSWLICQNIFQATIKDGIPSEKTSKIHLVDLAGRSVKNFLNYIMKADLPNIILHAKLSV